MYYSFFLDINKTDLVFRTAGGWSKEVHNLFDPEGSVPIQFDSEDLCKKDFYTILWDNETFRWGKVYGNEPEKKKKEPKEKIKVTLASPLVLLQDDISGYDKAEPIKIIYNDIPQINTVYNEDCLLTMSRMPAGHVHHIITSPPYNAGKRVSCGKNNAIYIGDENMYSEGYGDNLSAEEYEDWLFEVIRECIRVVKFHVFFNIQMLAKNKRTVLRIHGEFANNIKDKLIWVKDIAAPNIDQGIMRSRYEDIFIFSKDRPESRSFKDGEFSGSFSNVIEGMNASKNQHRKLNKATFPLYLPRTILNHWGEKGQTVYDPFNGTGTTGDACVIEKFNYIGSELDPLQCAVTNQRIKDRSAAQEFNFG